MLRALEPHQDLSPAQHPPPDPSDDLHSYNEPVRIEKDKKERKGFWDGMLRDRDRDKWRSEKEKEKDRERERPERMRAGDRREDDLSSAELTRMIGTSIRHSPSPSLMSSTRVPHRDRVRGLVDRSRSLRKSFRQRSKCQGGNQGSPT